MQSLGPKRQRFGLLGPKRRRFSHHKLFFLIQRTDQNGVVLVYLGPKQRCFGLSRTKTASFCLSDLNQNKTTLVWSHID